MVEPQEPKIREQILTETSSHSSRINELSTSLPAEILAEAERKVEGFALVKAEIDSKMSEIHDRLAGVHALVRENQ